MARKKSLVFKQSKKGIFKFKVQFIIIIILSFLSVFILTMSLNLRERLNSTYNNVVNSVEKFDYFNQDTAYGNGSSTSEQMTQTIIASSLDYNVQKTYFGEDEQRYNVVFNALYYPETDGNYITKAFASQEMQDLFLASTATKFENDKNLRLKSRAILVDYLYKEITSENWVNSALKAYASNNLEAIEADRSKIKQINDSNEVPDFQSLNDPSLFIYITNICESILGFFAYVQNTYSIINTKDLYIFITGNEFDQQKYITPSYAESWVLTAEDNLYSTNLENDPENQVYIEVNYASESERNSKIIESTKNNGLRGISFPIYKIIYSGDTTYSNSIVEDDAFQLEPRNEDWSGKISGLESRVVSVDDFWNLMYNSAENQPQYDWFLKPSTFTPNLFSPISSNLASLYMFHLKVVATFANVGLETRREFTLFDNLSQIQYRAVILDEKTQTKTIILNQYDGGRMPVNKGEVLVSEQFAREHDIHVNDSIKQGSAILTVSGFATDTLSYYPISDDDLPIPQTKNSAILYATPETFRTIVADTSTSSGVAIPRVLFRNFIWKDEKSDTSKLNSLYNSTENITSFDDSSYSMSWTLQPLVVRIYTAVTMLLSVVIALIAIVGLIISAKKIISQNAKQIGILKALGYSPQKIAVSYVAQSLFIAIFIIPIAWFIGLFTQSAYVQLFIPYFSIQLHQIQISFVPLLLGLLIFGLFGVLFSYLTALKVTKKPVANILLQAPEKRNRSLFLDWISKIIFRKARFSIRFSLNMTSTNRKNVYLMTSIVLLTSFLVSLGFSIPATVNSVKQGYYKNINYANSYDYYQPVSNAPLSKGIVKYTEDPDTLDKSFHEITTSVGKRYIYDDPKYYYDSSYDASPLSKYIYLGNNNVGSPEIQNTFAYLVSDSANASGAQENQNSLLNLLSEQFGNNFAQGIGSQFSIGTIEQAMAIVFNTLDGGQGDGVVRNDATLEYIYGTITDNLTQAIPMILSSILGTTPKPGVDWKTSILSVITQAAPPFVQSYLSEESRKEQYNFGYGVRKVVKNKETLITNVNATNEEYAILATGIDNNQQAYNLNDELKQKIFINEEQQNQLEKVFGGMQTEDINFDGFKLYDAANNTLNVPTAVNNQSLKTYNLENDQVVENVKTNNQQILFATKDGSFDQLPVNAWVYDDSDFIYSDYYNSFSTEQQNKIKANRNGIYQNYEPNNYLNLQDLDNNKLTYRNLYDNNKLDEFSYMFNDFALDENGGGVSYVRPYYEYRNVKLFIPKELISNSTLNGVNKWANKIYNAADLDEYFSDDVKASDVPISVTDAWQKMYGEVVNNSDYIKISPYALEYSMAKEDANNRGLKNLTGADEGYLWYSDAFNAGLLSQANTQVKYLNSGLKINFEYVGTFDSYNGNLVLIDQSIANLMNNFSNVEKIDLKNNTLEDNPIGTTNIPDFKSDYTKYQLHDANEDIYLDDWIAMQAADSTNYQQKVWNNGKLSNIKEPVDLTTGFIQTTQENNGLLMMGKSKIGNISDSMLKINPESQKLLSTEQELINQITALAISIAMLLIVSVIVTASILVILVADIYITKYKMFMTLMKSFGYTNKKIVTYSFGIVSLFSLTAWIIGTLLSWLLISGIIFALSYFGLALPLTLAWWPIVASLAVVGFAYVSSIIISVIKLRGHEPAELLKETNE